MINGEVIKMEQYRTLVKDILFNGEDIKDRTGVGTRSIFGYQMKFNLEDGFPAVTSKRLAWKSVVGELLWFLEGSTDERRLAELTYGKDREDLVNKTTIWTANANKQGLDLGHYNDEYIKELGPVYGSQWRKFSYFQDDPRGVDQVANVINTIKNNPDSRRIIMSAWNPMVLQYMTLPPCHVMAQFVVRKGKLSCQLYQRSADVGLGVPFNIASYALLTHIIARECDLGVGEYVHTIGDAHIYVNHLADMAIMLDREPYSLPTLHIDDSFNLVDRLASIFKKEDSALFTLKDYQYHPEIKMDMAV